MNWKPQLQFSTIGFVAESVSNKTLYENSDV